MPYFTKRTAINNLMDVILTLIEEGAEDFTLEEIEARYRKQGGNHVTSEEIIDLASDLRREAENKHDLFLVPMTDVYFESKYKGQLIFRGKDPEDAYEILRKGGANAASIDEVLSRCVGGRGRGHGTMGFLLVRKGEHRKNIYWLTYERRNVSRATSALARPLGRLDRGLAEDYVTEEQVAAEIEGLPDRLSLPDGLRRLVTGKAPGTAGRATLPPRRP